MYWISQSIGVDSEGHLMYNEVELEGEIFRVNILYHSSISLMISTGWRCGYGYPR
jgi:hypothetical protein